MKDFTELKSLQKQLSEQAAAKAQAEREQREREEQLAREANLFRESVGEVKPLNAPPRVEPPPQNPLPIPHQRIADDEAVMYESLSDEFSIDTLLETDEALSYARSGIGPDVLRKLRGGEWVIQGQLDLHGLRTDDAREAVALFLRESVRRGFRCVRIIHGKGLGSGPRGPVLKQAVNVILRRTENVVAFCSANQRDGGTGAIYVLLQG